MLITTIIPQIISLKGVSFWLFIETVCNLEIFSASKDVKRINNHIKLIIMDLTGIFITAIVFGFIFGIFYIFVRKKERLTLIEKGADASIFVSKRRYHSLTLKFGMLFIGVAIGILLGNILEVTTTLQEEVSYFSMIFLFGGIGLVINHFLEKKQEKQKE